MKTLLKNRIDDKVMEKLSIYLEEGMGLHYTRDRWADLEKKMIPIIHQLGYKNLSEGITWLTNQNLNQDLINILAYNLTIGETYFFRDTKRMEVLENHVLPEIIQRHFQDKKIRIWSAACCTGEEPYSIAMMLDRLIPYRDDWDISIMGTDINKEFLRKAELANYKKWSFRATPQDVRAKYFAEHKDGVFTLIPKVKKMVTFTYANILEDMDADKFRDIDLILCHNVLIYFSPKQIKKTIQRLTHSLITDGWLSISSIETPFVNEAHLSIRNFAGAIFFKKTEKAQAVREEKTPTSKKVALAPIKEDETLLKVVFPDFIKLEQPVIQFPFSTKDLNRMEKKGEKSLSPIEIPNVKAEIDYEELYRKKQYREIVLHLKPFQKKDEFLKNNLQMVLLLIRTYANLGDLSDALELCKEALKADKLEPNLHYIHATICMAQGEITEAIKALKKTLFLEPNYIAAHYMLGTLEHQQGNHKASKISFRTALELLEDFEPDEELLGAEELTASRARDMIENTLRRSQ